MGSNTPVTLSIYITSYNHEKYIIEALDSVLMQKTDYSLEVLVGEDLSTDSTRLLLKEYEKKHPKRLTVFYREQNMFGKPVDNAMDLMLRCRGKYIIALESDDFWTDPNKIQAQIEFLENHPEYIAVAHNCVTVGENSEPNGENYPECRRENYRAVDFFDGFMPGQLTTVMYRNPYIDKSFDCSLIKKLLWPWDQTLYFSLMLSGKIYCMQKPMSAYRHITGGGSSFSANFKFNYAHQLTWHKELLAFAYKNGSKKTIKNTEAKLLGIIIIGLKTRQANLREAKKELFAFKYRLSAAYLWLWRGIKRRILKLLTPKSKRNFCQTQM